MKEVNNNIHLGYTDYISDKVYKTEIVKVADGKYQVKFSYGRRYNVNNEYWVPTSPVNYADAVYIRDKQVKQKIRKGYVIENEF